MPSKFDSLNSAFIPPTTPGGQNPVGHARQVKENFRDYCPIEGQTPIRRDQWIAKDEKQMPFWSADILSAVGLATADRMSALRKSTEQ